MKLMIKILCLSFIGLFSMQGQAQNYAYMDSAKLLSELPEVKQADSQLETLQKQLQKQGQQKVADLQAKYQTLSAAQEAGDMSPKQIQEEAEKLKQEEMAIGQFEQDMQRKIGEKRQSLLQPILDKVQTAIDAVAAEKGYTYVFDSSTGILLYADESKDITALVKAKM